MATANFIVARAARLLDHPADQTTMDAYLGRLTARRDAALAAGDAHLVAAYEDRIIRWEQFLAELGQWNAGRR